MDPRREKVMGLNISDIPLTEPVRIIIGAGPQEWPGWIPTQQAQLDLRKPENWEVTFQGRLVDAFLCEHVWEHLAASEGKAAAALCFEWLKPGGYLRVAVPDGYFPDPDYQLLARVGGPGPADHPAAGHQICYNYQMFSDVFTGAGFAVDLLEFCDEDGRLHYNQWSFDDGPIYRSLMMDHRNRDGAIRSVSLILDAKKPL
jgi:predicted SAM-dependent methyltransferase